LPDYRFSAKALLDLSDIFAYGAKQFGRRQADNYFVSMRATFRRLAINPNIGRTAGNVATGLRRHSLGTYVVFYEATTSGIYIVRVIHTSRLTGHLDDDLT
jgi:toxin ParE1/3/4